MTPRQLQPGERVRYLFGYMSFPGTVVSQCCEWDEYEVTIQPDDRKHECNPIKKERDDVFPMDETDRLIKALHAIADCAKWDADRIAREHASA